MLYTSSCRWRVPSHRVWGCSQWSSVCIWRETGGLSVASPTPLDLEPTRSQPALTSLSNSMSLSSIELATQTPSSLQKYTHVHTLHNRDVQYSICRASTQLCHRNLFSNCVHLSVDVLVSYLVLFHRTIGFHCIGCWRASSVPGCLSVVCHQRCSAC